MTSSRGFVEYIKEDMLAVWGKVGKWGRTDQLAEAVRGVSELYSRCRGMAGGIHQNLSMERSGLGRVSFPAVSILQFGLWKFEFMLQSQGVEV